MMASVQKINLIGVGWPVCLLECQNALNALHTGEELEVKVQDPEVLQELIMIAERSGKHRVSHHHEGDCYRIHIWRQQRRD